MFRCLCCLGAERSTYGADAYDIDDDILQTLEVVPPSRRRREWLKGIFLVSGSLARQVTGTRKLPSESFVMGSLFSFDDSGCSGTDIAEPLVMTGCSW